MLRPRIDWPVWNTTASLTVIDPDALPIATEIAGSVLAQVTAACSRFEPGSELSRLQSDRVLTHGAMVSPLLADLIAASLSAAAITDGRVDPTLGADLAGLGYDRDFAELEPASGEVHGVPFSVTAPRRPGWTRIRLDGCELTVPDDIRLDLGATAKAVAADRIAERVARVTGSGVLVSLGGDLSTAGETPDGRWEVLVQDLDTDPAQQVSIGSGTALATSSTQKRRWTHRGVVHQHILDPAFGVPVVPVWRSVTVAATTCLDANAFSTAAIVLGAAAPSWLRDRGADARLVDLDGRVLTTGRWPLPAEPVTELSLAGGVR